VGDDGSPVTWWHKAKTIWQGDPLSCVRTFGTKSCKLCFREKIAILELIRKHPSKAINVRNEIHGACRHKPRFHRFIKRNMYSTDESSEDENRPSSTTSTDTSEFDFIDIDETRQAEPDDPKDILCEANFLETRAKGNLARSHMKELDHEGTGSFACGLATTGEGRKEGRGTSSPTLTLSNDPIFQ